MMRAHVRFASVFVLGAAFSAGCGSGSGGTGEGDLDSALEDSSLDTGGAEVDVDSGEPDSFNPMLDSGAPETTAETSAETAVVDTGSDTGPPDTGPPDTGPPDTGPADMGVDTAPSCTVGAACNDSNACTTGETFNAACVCTGGTAVVCMDTNACTVDTCLPASGCSFPNAPDGTSCGAGKLCTAGTCGDLCTPGASCSDANACTTGETFSATCACTGGTATSCDDSNPCTTDSCVTATGCSNIAVTAGTTCGTGKICSGTSCVDTSTILPTVTITSPAVDGTKKSFTTTGPTKDDCNPLRFTVAVNAPLKIKSLTWHLFAPTGEGGGVSGEAGTCPLPSGSTFLDPWRAGLGFPIYPFQIDQSKYGGLTTGTFSEDIAVSGLYGGGLWLWCTNPGTSSTAFLTSPTGGALPAINGGLQPLSRSCYSTTIGSTTTAGQAYTFFVRLTDEAGNKATAERKFYVYKL